MEFTWRRPSERTEVRFCSDLDEVLGAAMDGHVFAVVDGNVARLWDVGPGRLGVTGKNVFLLDVREEHKSPSTLGRIWNAMADAGMVREGSPWTWRHWPPPPGTAGPGWCWSPQRCSPWPTPAWGGRPR
jgi:hypothetical protein